MSYPTADSSREVWRAVRDAMPEGLTPQQVRDVIAGRRRSCTVRAWLRYMGVRGYLQFDGRSNSGRWLLGDVTMPGESTERGAPGPQGLRPHPGGDRLGRPCLPQAAPAAGRARPLGPNSVWSLGGAPCE